MDPANILHRCRRAAACLPFCAALLLSGTASASLDALVDGATFFDTPADSAERAAGQRGEWLEATGGRVLRLLRPSWQGGTIAEALLQYSADGAPQRAQLVLYSRGDDGALDGRAFADRFAAVSNRVAAIAGTSGAKRNVPANSRLVELRSWEWTTPGAVWRLDVASQGRASNLRGEFIRLWLLPPAAAPSAPAGSGIARPGAASPVAPVERATRRDTAKKADLLGNIVRDGSRVTLANIPMVDQGDKGYCAAATLSRLLAYYGIATVDQHELAAAMGTDAEGGTSGAAMKKAMDECGRKFGLRLAEIDELDYRDAVRLVNDYNSAARKRGTPRIENRGGAPVVGDPFWAVADGPTLRDARAGTPQKQRQWLKKAGEYIDAGIPVVWDVYCGLFPERGAMISGRGGHLRLIVGYDESAGIVYYSDTWGPGHECKPMPLAEAIAITRARFALFPKW